jgi:hypothetical protein
MCCAPLGLDAGQAVDVVNGPLESTAARFYCSS